MDYGKLILCTTPIGNKGDITLNVISALRSGEYFFAEDTRRLKSLFRDHQIEISNKVISSFHDQSASSEVEKVVQVLLSGKSVHYFSEAGSPVISDPGFPLVTKAQELGVEVITLPGASSIISALELSGVPCIPFSFQGFVPREKSKILKLIDKLSLIGGTFVFFESPRRVGKFLDLMEELIDFDFFPDEICLIREITKVNQQVVKLNKINFISTRGSLVELGEFVIILKFSSNNDGFTNLRGAQELSRDLIYNGLNKKKLAKLLSIFVDDTSKNIYQRLK